MRSWQWVASTRASLSLGRLACARREPSSSLISRLPSHLPACLTLPLFFVSLASHSTCVLTTDHELQAKLASRDEIIADKAARLGVLEAALLEKDSKSKEWQEMARGKAEELKEVQARLAERAQRVTELEGSVRTPTPTPTLTCIRILNYASNPNPKPKFPKPNPWQI